MFDNFDLNKFLQCTVCKELKSDPRETQCCHKLCCQDCIQKMTTTDICPSCRQRTSFVENPLASKLIRNKLGDDFMTENQRFPFDLIGNNRFPFDLTENNHFPFGFSQLINLNPGRNDPDTRDKAFRVTVLTLEDRKIDIYVEPSDTIKILKLKVQRKDGMLFIFFSFFFLCNKEKRSCIFNNNLFSRYCT
jgi:hypothetical protein